MPRLPAPENYALNTPRASLRLTDAQPTRQVADTAMGEVMQRIGSQLADYTRQETEKLDNLKAQEALSRIQQARLDLTMGEKGAYQVKGGNVLTPDYASGFKSQLNTTIEGIMDGLTPSQRARLQPHALHELRGFQTDVARHSMQQAEIYKGIVEEGQISTAVNVGIAQRGDPIAFGAEIAKLHDLAMERARAQGLTGEAKGEKDALIAIQQKVMSPVYVGAISGLLDDRNVARAKKLLAEGGLAIAPEARLKLNEHIKKVEEAEQTRTVAGEELKKIEGANSTVGRVTTVLGTAPVMAAAMTSAESGRAGANGGMTQADGTIIKGPVITDGAMKGQRAYGPHQLMVSTAKEAAKRTGLSWDETLFMGTGADSRAYHDRLQAAHVEKLMSMFSTQEELFAAYNAGEGHVIKAKEKFAKAQKLIAMGVAPVLPGGYNAAKDGPLSFLDFLPKPGETKPYVSRAIAAAAAMPDIIRPTKQELAASVTARFPGRPDLAKDALGIIEHNLTLKEEARKQEIADAKETAFKFMAQGKAFIELPPSLLNKMPVKDQDEVRAEFTKHATGTPRDSNPGLLAQINSDPGYVGRIPVDVWEGPMRNQLSAYDHARFTKQRAALLGGEVREAETLDDGAINRVMGSRLTFLGIQARPEKNDTKAWAVINSTRAALDQSVLARQKQLNRRLTDAELIDHVDKMFRYDIQVPNTFAGFEIGAPVRMAILTMSYSDIPDDAVAAIKADLKKQGIPNPQDQQILAVYKQTKLGLR
jgi:hypothetical protein